MSRARTPVVLQMEMVECGAACLGIVLGYYGKWVPLEELRVKCGVTRDGSNARSMLRAARGYGLEAKAFRYGLATLSKQTAPFVVFWQSRHFLVVEGFTATRVYVNDPATGRRAIDRGEFDRSYSGLMLRFRPTAQFVRSGQPPRLWPLLSRRLRGSRQAVAAFLVLSLLLIAPGVLLPAFTRIFIDEVLLREQSDWLQVLLAVMAGTIVVQAAMTWMLQLTLLHFENRLSLSGSAQLLWRLLRLPYLFFSQRMPADLANRLRANDEVALALGQDLGRTLAQLLAAAVYVPVMLLFDVAVAAVAIFLTGVSVLTSQLARGRLHDISTRVESEEHQVFIDTAVTALSIESLKATGSEAAAFSRWAGHHAASINAEQRLGTHTALIQSVPFLTSALTTAVVLGLGSARVLDGELTIGGVIAIQALAAAFKLPMEELAGFLTRLEKTRASMRRVEDVLRYPLDDEDSPPSQPAGGRQTAGLQKVKLDGRLALRSVRFGYDAAGSPLIDGLDLNMEPGARVALVGSTASGKSTIARLAAGLYRPWSGQVLLDGVPADDWPLPLRRNSIAWVDQEIVLFEGTVTENLTLWDASIPEHVVTKAARDAEIHDAIASRPGGYSGFVLENGANFSGGEAQRLELARALAMEPSILILDEATSALDPAVEAAIDGNLRRRGCTTLIVAHRLSTIRDCDEIVVLEAGRVVERGTHETLMTRQGPYLGIVEN